MRDYRLWLALGGLLLAGRLLYPVLAGERSAPPREEERQTMVFVCHESGETFVLRARNTMETHPRTGKATLTPGLYCQQCGTWRASPPLEILQQDPGARNCPVHKSAMSSTGPAPAAK